MPIWRISTRSLSGFALHAPKQTADVVWCGTGTFLPIQRRSFGLWRRPCVREACPPVLPYGRMTVDRETPMLLPPDLRSAGQQNARGSSRTLSDRRHRRAGRADGTGQRAGLAGHATNYASKPWSPFSESSSKPSDSGASSRKRTPSITAGRKTPGITRSFRAPPKWRSHFV